MRIPVLEATGGPTVSASMLRTYGAGGRGLPGHEEDRGCPRRFKAKYIDRDADQKPTYALRFGTLVHDCLQTMEDESVTPDEAVVRHFPADLGPEAYAEVVADLNAYMERGSSPIDRYAALATEQHLTAALFTEDDGTTYYVQGYIDWLGVDPDEPSTLHAVDYKSSRSPLSRDEVRGDLQMRLYDLLVRKNLHRYTRTPTPNVVMHLDLVKFSDVAVRYTQEDADVFEQWLIAMVRHIVADDDATPVLNPGCAWCPVRDSCPEFATLPTVGETLAHTRPGTDDDDAVLAWRDKANAARLLLVKAVKEVDDRYHDRAYAAPSGVYATPTNEFIVEPKYADEVDLRALHRALGDTFYDVASASKTAVRKATKDWPTDQVGDVHAAINRVTTGSKVVRRTREDDQG